MSKIQVQIDALRFARKHLIDYRLVCDDEKKLKEIDFYYEALIDAMDTLKTVESMVEKLTSNN